ncbi:hypothetical protein P9209_16640 [Prescottella defluvii]|nr:hypothetical protein P9209_16640 [Prescottella defluvii]
MRGYRIELGEIDAVLADHPGVEFAATLGRTAPSGETVLVSYVRPETTRPSNPANCSATSPTTFRRTWFRR